MFSEEEEVREELVDAVAGGCGKVNSGPVSVAVVELPVVVVDKVTGRTATDVGLGDWLAFVNRSRSNRVERLLACSFKIELVVGAGVVDLDTTRDWGVTVFILILVEFYIKILVLNGSNKMVQSTVKRGNILKS